jgi:ketosteroid isomerase-like protein
VAETIPTSVSPEERDSLQAVIRFNEALNAGDVEAMLRWMAEDGVFENTYPAPDGRRYAGKAAVRAFWEEFFRASRQPRLEFEELFACGERCILRWVYHWLEPDGATGHVRGVDVYRVRDGLIVEKLSYVKG